MTPFQAQSINQCFDQGQESLMFGTFACSTEKLSDLDQGRLPAGAAVRLMLYHRHA